MSMYFKALNPLFSSINVEDHGQHTKVTLFSEGKNIGTLVIGSERRRDLLEAIFTGNDGRDVVHRTHAGNHRMEVNLAAEAGPGYRNLKPEAQLLSEVGEVVTYGELLEEARRSIVPGPQDPPRPEHPREFA